MKKLLLTLGFIASYSSHGVVIDDFSVAQVLSNNGGSDFSVASAGVGGVRKVSINQPGTSDGLGDVVEVNINTALANTALFQGTGLFNSVEYSLLYDNNGAGLGSLDLTDLGADDAIKIIYQGSANFSLAVNLSDSDSSYSYNLGLLSPLAGLNTLFVDFETFVLNGIDVTGVESIEFAISASTGADFAFKIVESDNDPSNDPPVVPEPSTTGLLLGLMAGGGAMLRRRMKK